MKTAIIYWSQTGNTQAMAENILAGIRKEGGEADIFAVSEISPAEAAAYDVLLLGCPAMGAEELEALVPGKKVGLFGSYDWGDGEWMRLWQERAEGAGLHVEDTLIVNMNDDPAEPCMAFGKQFA